MSSTSPAHHPVTSQREDNVLKQMDYDSIAKNVPDDKETIAKAKVLTGGSIARRKMTPQQVINKLEDNHVILLRRSWKGEILQIILLFFTLLISTYIVIAWMPTFGAVVMCSLLPLSILSSILHKRYNRKYVISSDSVTLIIGLKDWKLSRISMPISGFKAVQIRKTISQRILNIGDIDISTVLYEEPEMPLTGIDNPQFYVTILRILHDKPKPDDEKKQKEVES